MDPPVYKWLLKETWHLVFPWTWSRVHLHRIKIRFITFKLGKEPWWFVRFITRFILSEGDDVLMVVVDESRKGTRQPHPHANLIIPPLTCGFVLLQAHQTPEAQKKHCFERQTNRVQTSSVIPVSAELMRALNKELPSVVSNITVSVLHYLYSSSQHTQNSWSRLNPPAHEVSKYVHAVQVGVLTATVHVTTRHRLTHLVRISINRQHIICEWNKNILLGKLDPSVIPFYRMNWRRGRFQSTNIRSQEMVSNCTKKKYILRCKLTIQVAIQS